MRDDDDAAVAAAHEDLVRGGAVEPLADEDERLWLDCDLASLAENRLGDVKDPRALDDARRAEWSARATTDEACSMRVRRSFERCYWLRDGASRVGTIAVSTSTLGGAALRVSSLYVFPSHRHAGVGRRALERVRATLALRNLGVSLETSWCWQRSVRFYLRAGFWLRMWKRDLQFVSYPNTPPPAIIVAEDEITLSARAAEGPVVLSRARRRGDTLELTKIDKEKVERDPALRDAWWLASSTMALAMALAGWPLVRSPEEYERSWAADGGPPEALARRIVIWEALDRHYGFRVDAPRIRGLAYATWDELQARWRAEQEAFEATLAQETNGAD